jgi:hypothetical protein
VDFNLGAAARAPIYVAPKDPSYIYFSGGFEAKFIKIQIGFLAGKPRPNQEKRTIRKNCWTCAGLTEGFKPG